MAQLQAIARETGINDEHDMLAKEGFAAAEPDALTFGGYRLVAGDAKGAATRPYPADMARILGTIGIAKRQADYVIVSIHSHEIKDGRKDAPADFLREFARRCIEEGAHAVIGHGQEHNTADALDARSGGGTRGLEANPDVWKSVVADLVFEDGELASMDFLPIALGYGAPRYRRGWPRLTDDDGVLVKLKSLSRELGTELTNEGAKASRRSW